MSAALTSRRLTDLYVPCRETQDWEAYGRLLRRDWTADRLAEIVLSGSPDSAEAAVVALGLVGGMKQSGALATALRHSSDELASAAEQALWRIWFRSGGPEAQQDLYEIVRYIGARDVFEAIGRLDQLIRFHPVYAEAYHQRGGMHAQAGNYREAARDFRRAIHLNGFHFAAHASLAHCLVMLCEYDEASQHFDTARRIHPRLNLPVRQKLAEYTSF